MNLQISVSICEFFPLGGVAVRIILQLNYAVSSPKVVHGAGIMVRYHEPHGYVQAFLDNFKLNRFSGNNNKCKIFNVKKITDELSLNRHFIHYFTKVKKHLREIPE
jgi:hypothetical protein